MELTQNRLPRIHLYLTVQTVVVILGSLNRLGDWTQGYVAANEFLRWVDFNNMLLLPPISLIAFYLLKKHLEAGATTQHRCWHLAMNLLFVLGVYLLGSGYGNHEVTNYLHERFCSTNSMADSATSALCRIVIFNDDEFSHWVFFGGFILINTAMMLIQVLFPELSPIRWRDGALLIGNSLFIALGIFANLAFETIGFDLYVVATLALLSLILLTRPNGSGFRQPLTIYYATAYTIGLVAAFLYKSM